MVGLNVQYFIVFMFLSRLAMILIDPATTVTRSLVMILSRSCYVYKTLYYDDLHDLCTLLSRPSISLSFLQYLDFSIVHTSFIQKTWYTISKTLRSRGSKYHQKEIVQLLGLGRSRIVLKSY